MMQLLSLQRPMEIMEPMSLFSVPFGKGCSGGNKAREGVSGGERGCLGARMIDLETR